MKKQIIALTALELLFAIAILSYFLISPAQAIDEQINGSNFLNGDISGTNNKINNNLVEVKGLEKSEVYLAFKKIKSVPYTKHLNCKNKSEQFAKFLHNHGYRNIKLLQIWNKDYSKGHQVVLINGFIYDPTCGYYEMKESKFLKIARNSGLDGTIISQDYNG